MTEHFNDGDGGDGGDGSDGNDKAVVDGQTDIVEYFHKYVPLNADTKHQDFHVPKDLSQRKKIVTIAEHLLDIHHITNMIKVGNDIT